MSADPEYVEAVMVRLRDEHPGVPDERLLPLVADWQLPRLDETYAAYQDRIHGPVEPLEDE